MPIFRRPKAAPEDVAAVLRRLGSLRHATEAVGWVPPAPATPEPPGQGDGVAGELADDGRVAARGSPTGRVAVPFRGFLLDPGRRGAAVLVVIALAAVLGGAWFFVRAAPAASSPAAPASSQGEPRSVPTFAAGAPASPAAVTSGWPTASASSVPLVIDVVGKVAAPGVVTVAAGSRVRDAIAAAGGVLPGTDLTALNLASKLVDGEQIFVGIPPPSGASAESAGGVVGGGPAATPNSAPAIVDLNVATQAELQTLPGVGPVLAQRIVEWRAQHGHFASVTQLQQVAGIGPSKYAALAGRVRV